MKYNIHDVKTLWTMSIDYGSVKSCSTLDPDAIIKIIKPCKILINDAHSKSIFNSNLQPSIEAIDIVASITPCATKSQEKTSTFRPRGLKNPSNHCYINSILQSVSRILIDYNEELKFNNNIEGNLIKKLFKCINSQYLTPLDDFKKDLSNYNAFFGGRRQEDAYECLLLLIDVLHIGTKTCILDVDDLNLEDDLFASVSKDLFLCTTKITFKCINCEFTSNNFSQIQTFLINPKPNKSIFELLMNNFKNSVTKLCSLCNTDTIHEENIIIDQPPKILVILVNRFDSSSSGQKNKTALSIDRTTDCFGFRYELMAYIDHHGNTTTSGHYTAILAFSDRIFLCNDNVIEDIEFRKTSNAVYILFYKLTK